MVIAICDYERVLNMEILNGHYNEDTAYVVDDYPYGYTLRTKIRYWVETVKKKGDRFVSQTLNPKTGRWNKPKKSTYSAVMVMGKDDNGHITTRGISRGWSDEEAINKFISLVGEDYPFNEHQLHQLKLCTAIARTNERIECKIVETTNWTEEQRREHDEKEKETLKTLNKIVAYEYHNLN